MTLADIHSKPVEELMMTLKVGVWFSGFKQDGYDHLGQPLYKKTDQWWEAVNIHTRPGYGSTPREAILDWFKKLDDK